MVGERRKDAESSPYINHPLAVAKVLAVEAEITDEDVLIAALLHDTIEDTETTLDELADKFGADISRIVSEVSDEKTLEKQKRKELQIKRAPSLSIEAKMIQIAEKVCNIRDIINMPPADWSTERKMQYLEWTRKVVDGCRGIHYWKEKTDIKEEYESQRKFFKSAIKLRLSLNPAERSFYKNFIAPELGPKKLEKKQDLYRPLFSFIDNFGDEIRLSLTSINDYDRKPIPRDERLLLK